MFRLRGFSIIELMIVVAILAALSALAYPAYQDYVIRGQVAEGASLATGVKVSVSDYYYNKGVAPASNGEAHLPIATDIRGRNVLRVDVSNGGVISVTFGNRANQALTSRRLVLQPTFGVGSTEWSCSSADIATQWLPVSCR